MDQVGRLTAASALFERFRTPDKVARAWVSHGISGALAIFENELNAESRRSIEESVASLVDRQVDVCFLGEELYPRALAELRRPPAVLFTWGNQSLLSMSAIGMCGSRNVSDRGLEAARSCGLEVASHNQMIVSGYAKGVDTETHLAALASGGQTAIVLAEGINHFRRKKVFDRVDFDRDRIIVLSQFPPGQAWNVGAAMTRNRVIVGLGRALVVVEAGETGGTLNAGLEAIKSGRPVLALEFSNDATPDGNRILHDSGAIRVRSRQHLSRVLDDIVQSPPTEPISAQQLSLL
jgi:DNA processing protein